MNILLAAGVFFPDVGGPAIHVRKIADRLSSEGFAVTVLCYGDDSSHTPFPFTVVRVSRKHHKILQWIMYVYHCLRLSFGASLVYAFDPTAAGFPAYAASKLFQKPFVIRMGGDPIWEREAEMGHRVMPITAYYDQGLYKKDKPLLYRAIKIVINGATAVVFYNQFWKDFYHAYFGTSLEKIRIVKNPAFRREAASPELPQDPIILFAGRFVTYKNLPLVMRAFETVRAQTGKGKLVLVGKGPEEDKLKKLRSTLVAKESIEFIESLPQEQLFEKIKQSAFAIGPALSEFNPNFILEALSFGKPVILSKGHGLSVDLPEDFLFNPLDQNEFESKLKFLLNPGNYRKAVEVVGKLDMNQTWEKVTHFHLHLIRELTK